MPRKSAYGGLIGEMSKEVEELSATTDGERERSGQASSSTLSPGPLLTAALRGDVLNRIPRKTIAKVLRPCAMQRGFGSAS